MLCEWVAVERNRIHKDGDDDSWEVRRPKILGIEVQGLEHGFFFFLYEKNMAEENRVQIFINEKEIQYSHQNIVATINSFLPNLTNDE